MLSKTYWPECPAAIKPQSQLDVSCFWFESTGCGDTVVSLGGEQQVRYLTIGRLCVVRFSLVLTELSLIADIYHKVKTGHLSC